VSLTGWTPARPAWHDDDSTAPLQRFKTFGDRSAINCFRDILII
jgi:hypothetical protein